jgi:membrane protein DedA with SNARE-associated domain
MIFTLSQIINWLEVYKYFVLFPVTIFEGPIITVIAGYLSSLGFLNFYVAYGVIVLGDTVGDILFLKT